MNNIPQKAALVVLILVVSTCGCKSFLFGTKPATPIPTVFSTVPTLEQAQMEINRRYTSIRSFATDKAMISASGVAIPLRSSIAYEKPKNLRIRGGASLGLGTEIDLGSNRDEFWFWAKRKPEKHLYHAKHDQYATCQIRNVIPVEPEWLMESFGIIELKDSDKHIGPTRATDGNLQITSQIQTPRGIYSRIITFHPQTAAILRHEIYSPDNRRIVGTEMSEHTIDSNSGVLYAKKVVIHAPDANLTLTINLGEVKYNSLSTFTVEAFEMPKYDGYTYVDICSQEFQRQHIPTGITPPMPSEIFPTSPAPLDYPPQTHIPAIPPTNGDGVVGISASVDTYIHPGNF